MSATPVFTSPKEFKATMKKSEVELSTPASRELKNHQIKIFGPGIPGRRGRAKFVQLLDKERYVCATATD